MKKVHKLFLAFIITAISLLNFNSYSQQQESLNSFQIGIDNKILDQYFLNLSNFSGNVLVALNGKPIFKKSYGYANIELKVKNNLETKFRIGSLTKQFTSMAIMILQEQGKLTVDDKISDYLTDIPEIWKDITIHQLLTHTSGIMHSWELEGFEKNMMLHTNIQEVINKFKDQPLIGYPGEKFKYSGTGYFILSSLIEKVSDKTYGNFLEDEIFSKIGMQNTGPDEPEKIIKNRASGYSTDSTGTYNSTYIYMPILTGGGDLYSTIDDLLKWDQSLYDNSLISKESKKKMFTPEQNNYAYGWKVYNNDLLFLTLHTGSVPGFVSKISRFPNEKLLIVILSNNKKNKNPEIITGKFVQLVRDEIMKLGNNNLNKK